MSAVPSDPENKWVRRCVIAAMVLGGLYVGALVRLIVSADWNDVVATRMFGLSVVGSGALYLLASATSGSVAISRESRWSPRSMPKVAGAVVIIALVVGGIARWIVSGDLGDPLAKLLVQTGAIAGILLSILGWLPRREARD